MPTTDVNLEALFEEFLKAEKAGDTAAADRLRANSPAFLSSLLDVREQILLSLKQIKEEHTAIQHAESVKRLATRIRQSASILAASILTETEDASFSLDEDKLVSNH